MVRALAGDSTMTRLPTFARLRVDAAFARLDDPLRTTFLVPGEGFLAVFAPDEVLVLGRAVSVIRF